MDIQTHSRTQQIKRLSRHLYGALSALRYLLHLGWLGIAIVVFIPQGTLVVGDTAIPVGKDDYLLKGLILPLYALGLALMIKLNHHFRDLMKQYMKGHIFSDQAISSVKGALNTGIAFVLLSWVHVLTAAIYSYSSGAPLDFSFTTEILIALIYFGLMYTLLWALEIGRDLNEESEKTI